MGNLASHKQGPNQPTWFIHSVPNPWRGPQHCSILSGPGQAPLRLPVHAQRGGDQEKPSLGLSFSLLHVLGTAFLYVIIFC